MIFRIGDTCTQSFVWPPGITALDLRSTIQSSIDHTVDLNAAPLGQEPQNSVVKIVTRDRIAILCHKILVVGNEVDTHRASRTVANNRPS